MTTQTDTINSVPVLKAETIATFEPLSPSQLIWRRFRKHRMALVGTVGIIILVLFILTGSIIVPESAANQGDLYNRLKGPMLVHRLERTAPAGMFSTGSSMAGRSR